jgi:hypothetical protein
MQTFEYDNVERPVFWSWNSTSRIKRESRMFSSFEPDLLLAMRDKEIAFHYHTYGIGRDMYPRLEHFFKVISTDWTKENKEFLTALEAFNYPIFTLMYHPEYQLLEFLSDKTFNTVRNKYTIDIY